MASKAAKFAASTATSISKKYTVQSTGLWETIRSAFAIDANRSNGVPLNPFNRLPAPGSNDPSKYDDPVTLPAGDIADNPYWKRDHRRNYPRLSVVNQADSVALLTVGSAAAPRVELVGEAGSKALVAAQEQGKEAGLATYLANEGVEAAKRMLELTGGLPPLPSGQSLDATGKWDVHKWKLDQEQSYTAEYPCRNFV
ncbi:NADH-ubiquinone oxidoreductase [Cladorrhinum sp. PSN259]|nr:NADH-ubiquinone oxidoreductase [Cladorrhinum sp. PSN259]